MSAVEISLFTLVALVALALLFDFLNGVNDAANSIATVVSTGVLKPHQAVVMAAFFNVAAIFVFQLKVASTIGTGIVSAGAIDHLVIFGALVGAILWSLLTWYHGIPISATHALIGGIVGATIAKAGTAPLLWWGLGKIILFMLLSPLMGVLLGSLMMLAVSWLCVKQSPARADRWFRHLQLVSACAYSLGHGGNDAQKTIGIIWLLLLASGYLGAGEALPAWVIVSCYGVLGLGTLFGGWRIVRTMGQGITKLKPVGGFCAETGGAVTLFMASALGVPVSTTHVITSAIVGVGSVRRVNSVRWGLTSQIVWVWILTIPCSALFAAAAWWLGQRLL